MSTVIEDPAIPLVRTNGKKRSSVLYTMSTPNKTEETEENKERLSTRRFSNVGIKLSLRKQLYVKMKKTCDASLAMALIGIILMVIETELSVAHLISRSGAVSIMLKIAMTTSTVTLLLLIFIYHKLSVQLFTVNNSMENWRLAMEKRRMFTFLIEIIICMVHPIPGEFSIKWYTTDSDENLVQKPVIVPLDVVLSLPMFLRLYLVGRFIMFHSRLYQDVTSQSLGALNRVNFNFYFIFKSFMIHHAGYFLLMFMLGFFILTSWTLRLCEMYNDAEHASVHGRFMNSIWVITVTFLTVGYGDIVPNSYCGRGVAVLAGMTGIGTSALVVAVLAKRLELSRPEKYVHDFVVEIDIGKNLKIQAANIVKFGWKMYKYYKISNKTPAQKKELLRLQTLLLSAIYNKRELKSQRRLLHDNAVTLFEVGRSQSGIAASVASIQMRQISIEERITGIDNTLSLVYDKICELNRTTVWSFTPKPTTSSCFHREKKQEDKMNLK